MSAAARARALRVADALSAGRAPAPEDARLLAFEMRRLHATGEPVRLGVSRATEATDRRARRDELIVDTLGTMKGKARRRALDLEADLRRYAAIGFERNRRSGGVPESQRVLHEIVELNDGEALGFHSIYNLARQHVISVQ